LSCERSVSRDLRMYRRGSTVGDMMRTRRQHARLAYVMRVYNRESVAYAAASFRPKPGFKNL
jgi:hypothetical protein